VFLQSLSFTPSSVDQCLYVQSVNDVKTILAVNVDDNVITSYTVESMQEIKDLPNLKVLMKDMGQLQFCLSINADLSSSDLKLY